MNIMCGTKSRHLNILETNFPPTKLTLVESLRESDILDNYVIVSHKHCKLKTSYNSLRLQHGIVYTNFFHPLSYADLMHLLGTLSKHASLIFGRYTGRLNVNYGVHLILPLH